jgi:hypothetical protein
VRERIEYRFRVPSAAVFTLYSYSKALEYYLEYPPRVVLEVHRSIISDWLGLCKCTHKNNPKFQASHAVMALRAWVQHLFVTTGFV